jgi:hypothetical protein
MSKLEQFFLIFLDKLLFISDNGVGIVDFLSDGGHYEKKDN